MTTRTQRRKLAAAIEQLRESVAELKRKTRDTIDGVYHDPDELEPEDDNSE